MEKNNKSKKTVDVSIILPTYNEGSNVAALLEELNLHFRHSKYSHEYIFVDDSSDSTAQEISIFQKKQGNIVLIKREGAEAKTGLTKAFEVGFGVANGVYIVCMDTDLQHPPKKIIEMLDLIIEDKLDLVIASRYTEGGSSAGLTSFYRKMVSKLSTYFAWFLLPLTRKTSDPMTGFFTFRRGVLGSKKFTSSGFKVLVELLVSLPQLKVVDVPFVFRERVSEQSNASARQGLRYLRDTFLYFLKSDNGNKWIKYFALMFASGLIVAGLSTLNTGQGPVLLSRYYFVIILLSFLPFLKLVQRIFFDRTSNEMQIFARGMAWLFVSAWGLYVASRWADITLDTFNTITGWVSYFTLVASAWLVGIMLTKKFSKNNHHHKTLQVKWLVGVFILFFLTTITNFVSFNDVTYFILLCIYVVIILQGLFAIHLSIYSWESKGREKMHKSPTIQKDPKYSFTAIIPIKHEKQTVPDTVKALSKINYPDHLMQVILVIHLGTDDGTIQVAEKAIQDAGKSNIALITYNQEPVNKPHGLNAALVQATGDYVVIFDAEDEPHKDLFTIINTLIIEKGYDVIQSGVQLMNYMKNWYSLFNVLEYYFWFKSSLHFFASQGVAPLGGVTVFFRRKQLVEIGGWNINCLTEDAELGMRLSKIGAKIGVVYDPVYATQEETPSDIWTFVKQRTRWAQGFLQILKWGAWKNFPTLKQKLLALYVISWPITLVILALMLPFGIFLMLAVKVPPALAVMANVPLLMFVMFIIVSIIGLYEFTRDYKKTFPWKQIPLIILTLYPYTLLLAFSGLRAMVRILQKKNNWEKTDHFNTHRLHT